MLDIFGRCHLVIVIGIDEEEMVWQPTDGKYRNNGYKHSDDFSLGFHRFHLTFRRFTYRAATPEYPTHQGITD